MLVLPVGLEARSGKIPFVTIVIVVLTTVISALQFDSLKENKKQLLAETTSSDMLIAQVDVAVEYCPLDPKRSQAFCKHLNLLKEKSPQSLPTFTQALIDIHSSLSGEDKEEFAQTVDYVLRFEEWREVDGIKSLSSYALLNFELQRRDEVLKKHHREHNYYSRANPTGKALIQAQLTHGDWMHLIGNMFVLFVFGAAVEARIGGFAFFLIYLVGGSFGLWGNSYLVSAYTLGASANVYAAAGGFLAYFYRERMRVLVSVFFFHNSILTIPVLVFFPLFLLLKEFAGLVASDSNVAHAAHLLGGAAGFFIALGLKSLSPLPPGFVFEHEWADFVRAKKGGKGVKRIQAYHRIFKSNPGNDLIRSALLKDIALHLELGGAQTPAIQLAIKDGLPKFLDCAEKAESQWQRCKLLISRLDWSADPALAIDAEGARALVQFGDKLLKNGDWHSALKAYDLSMSAVARTKVLATIKNVLKQVITTVPNHGSAMSKVYTGQTKGSVVLPLYEDLMAQTRRSENVA